MDKVLFNTHDLVLIVIFLEGVMLAAMLALINKGKRQANLFLAGFLLMNALIAFELLSIWCVPFRDHLLENSWLNVFYVFGFAHFLQGPFLYFYTKLFIYNNYQLRRVELLHFIPGVGYIIFMSLAFYSLDDQSKMALIKDFNLFYDTFNFNILSWAKSIFPVAYAVLCLYELLRYKTKLKDHYSNIESIDMLWLRMLVSMFLFIWSWILVAHVLGHFLSPEANNIMGLTGNYLTMIALNALVVYNLAHSGFFEGIQIETRQPDNKEKAMPPHIAQLKDCMEIDKPFLEPNITLEQLAERLSISTSALSAIINRDFGQNFFEFINHYRVDYAKKLISEDKDKKLNIQTVMTQSGFNSKSAANRFFKKFTGVTPSQYRKQN